MRVKQRKGKHATGERKVCNMCQSNREDIDFEAERTEDRKFAMKQDNRSYSPEDQHTEQPDLTLKNVDCIPSFPNNISSLLGTTIRNNDDNRNIVCLENQFVPQPQSQPHPVYYHYYMPDNQSYTVPDWHSYRFNLPMLYFIY